MTRRWLATFGLAGQLLAGGFAIRELMTARRIQPPLSANDADENLSAGTFSVVVPARDEAERLPALLDALAPLIQRGVDVVVVDDESTDATARVATDAGARVVQAGARPPGWNGKPWALRVGVAAVDTEWVVCLDADTRPDSRLPEALVARAAHDGFDFVTVGGRFECPTVGAQWLHPALLTTLVYRYGAPGQIPRPRPSRMLANGQCMAFRRQPMRDVDGFALVAGEVVEDVALARTLAERGWVVEFLDGAALLTVRMFEDGASTWKGWGRSIALPGVESPLRQVAQLAVVAATMATPPVGLLMSRTRWGRIVNALLISLRLGTLVGTKDAYTRNGVGYWLSPAADPLAVGALANNIVRPRQTWRGRMVARSVRPIES